ncbi:MAG: DUF1499 domain-containing protein [Flavobacteriales bacterium]
MRFTILLIALLACNKTANTQERKMFKPCPNSPNCVSTQAEKKSQKMKPLVFEGEANLALQRVKKLIAQNPQAKLIEGEKGFLTYEFTTKLGKFIDDVEFLLDEEKSVIHFRSASRKGYGDLGKNRRRMKKIQKQWLLL